MVVVNDRSNVRSDDCYDGCCDGCCERGGVGTITAVAQ